jgi:pentatricopeptide repeat protein
LVRRLEAGDALHFAEDTSTYEDWECFGRLACAGQAAYLDIETACQHSHGGKRLTDAHITECARARVTILPRVWGSDQVFLQRHRAVYQKVLDKEYLTLFDGLLVRGDTTEARQVLKQMSGKVSMVRRLLAMFPGGITKRILAVRRMAKNVS